MVVSHAGFCTVPRARLTLENQWVDGMRVNPSGPTKSCAKYLFLQKMRAGVGQFYPLNPVNGLADRLSHDSLGGVA